MFNLALLASVSSARLLTYRIHDDHSALDHSAADPDHIVYYGNHHTRPELDCSIYSSRQTKKNIIASLQNVEALANSHQWSALEAQYPDITNLFGHDSATIVAWTRNFEKGLEGIAHTDSVLADELADYMRQANITGMREAHRVVNFGASESHHPRRLNVENLRALRADMVHLGPSHGLFKAASNLIECLTIHPMEATVEVQPNVRGAQGTQGGYPIDDGAHEAQRTTMFSDIDALLSDPDAAQIFHPMGRPSEEEPLSDPYFPFQWYLGGPPAQPYGADFIRAWELMTNSDNFRGMDRSAFPSSTSGELDFNIAIVDMGCGVNDDLLYDASNPICDEQTKIGSETRQAGHESDILDADALSAGARTGELIDEVQYGASYCQRPTDDVHLINEGHATSKEDYFSDPSNHGTSTASIIGAGWNDRSGIAGLCPFCSVKCIKISAEENDTTKVNMAGIFRALEYLAAFADVYPISNHSYGGFFVDAKEIEGHRRLAEAGALVIAAAGNYKCDIDPLAEAFGAFDQGGLQNTVQHSEHLANNQCSSSKGNATDPMMPASVILPSKLQVGAIGPTGNLSQFSNWGQRSVGIFAPGETIVSLRARNAKNTSAGNDEVMIQHGTSFSSPVTAAAAALVHRRMEQMCHAPTPEAIISFLESSATPVGGLDGKCSTGGTLNVFNALSMIPNLCE